MYRLSAAFATMIMQYNWVNHILHALFTIGAFFEAGPVTALTIFVMYFMIIAVSKFMIREEHNKMRVMSMVKDMDIDEIIKHHIEEPDNKDKNKDEKETKNKTTMH